jgi:hypothetical protein
MYKVQMRKVGQKKWSTIHFIKTMPGIKNGLVRTEKNAKFLVGCIVSANRLLKPGEAYEARYRKVN